METTDDSPVTRARLLMSPFDVRQARLRRKARRVLWIFVSVFALIEITVLFFVLSLPKPLPPTPPLPLNPDEFHSSTSKPQMNTD